MRTLKDKRFRYGTFSTVMMLLAVIVFVFANLLAGAVDLRRDLTAEQLYTLTDQSRNFLRELEQDISITFIAGAGREHPVVPLISRITEQLLGQFEAASPRISVQTRDPMLNPALVHRFAADAGLEDGILEFSVVVESGSEIRVVQPHEMIDAEFNPFTGASRITGFNVEREITRAIAHTTHGPAAVVYHITGSGEPPLPPSFVFFAESENFIVREVNAVMEDIPDSADIIFVTQPARDWTDMKADRVLAFLEAEGNAFFALDFTVEPMPNLARVLDSYGLSIGNELILEDNPQNIFPGRGTVYIIPSIILHPITENLQVRQFSNIVPFFTPALQLQPVRRTTLEIVPLWRTSNQAFSRSLASEAETLARVPDDTPGPFMLAAAVTDRIFLDRETYYTQIVVTSSFDFMTPWFTTYVGEANWYFVLNSLRWMTDQPPALFIPGRVPPGQQPLLITEGTANWISITSIGIIPLAIMAAGTFVWFRRRFS